MGFYDSGLIIASKIPFESPKFEPYEASGLKGALGACRGILSVVMPIKNKEGHKIGTLLIGNTHTEYGTGPDDSIKMGEEHPQYRMAREHMMERLSKIKGKKSVIMGGDMNSDKDMKGFRGTTEVFL